MAEQLRGDSQLCHVLPADHSYISDGLNAYINEHCDSLPTVCAPRKPYRQPHDLLQTSDCARVLYCYRFGHVLQPVRSTVFRPLDMVPHHVVEKRHDNI